MKLTAYLRCVGLPSPFFECLLPSSCCLTWRRVNRHKHRDTHTRVHVAMRAHAAPTSGLVNISPPTRTRARICRVDPRVEIASRDCTSSLTSRSRILRIRKPIMKSNMFSVSRPPPFAAFATAAEVIQHAPLPIFREPLSSVGAGCDRGPLRCFAIVVLPLHWDDAGPPSTTHTSLAPI